VPTKAFFPDLSREHFKRVTEFYPAYPMLLESQDWTAINQPTLCFELMETREYVSVVGPEVFQHWVQENLKCPRIYSTRCHSDEEWGWLREKNVRLPFLGQKSNCLSQQFANYAIPMIELDATPPYATLRNAAPFLAILFVPILLYFFVWVLRSIDQMSRKRKQKE
jgi:hypothetical protein